MWSKGDLDLFIFFTFNSVSIKDKMLPNVHFEHFFHNQMFQFSTQTTQIKQITDLWWNYSLGCKSSMGVLKLVDRGQRFHRRPHAVAVDWGFKVKLWMIS